MLVTYTIVGRHRRSPEVSSSHSFRSVSNRPSTRSASLVRTAAAQLCPHGILGDGLRLVRSEPVDQPVERVEHHGHLVHVAAGAHEHGLVGTVGGRPQCAAEREAHGEQFMPVRVDEAGQHHHPACVDRGQDGSVTRRESLHGDVHLGGRADRDDLVAQHEDRAVGDDGFLGVGGVDDATPNQ
jgi:hypothetical protein